MREILFRGKDFSGVINHSWCFGSLDTTEKDRAVIIYLDRFGNKCRVFVNPDTVGQYTGLTDKNGTKIFEGDIVTYEDAVADYEGYHDGVFLNCGSVEISEWDGICFTNRQTVEMDDLYESETTVCCEVIGNIHDNPELLRSVTE